MLTSVRRIQALCIGNIFKIMPAPASSCKLLPAPASSCPLLLAPASPCQLLSAPTSSCQLLPAPASSCQLLPAPASSWQLLTAPASSCHLDPFMREIFKMLQDSITMFSSFLLTLFHTLWLMKFQCVCHFHIFWTIVTKVHEFVSFETLQV